MARLSAVFYYGLGQSVVLGSPALPVVFLAPVRRPRIVDATLG